MNVENVLKCAYNRELTLILFVICIFLFSANFLSSGYI